MNFSVLNHIQWEESLLYQALQRTVCVSICSQADLGSDPCITMEAAVVNLQGLYDRLRMQADLFNESIEPSE